MKSEQSPLEQALIEVEVANAQAIELGRRLPDLMSQIEGLKRDIDLSLLFNLEQEEVRKASLIARAPRRITFEKIPETQEPKEPLGDGKSNKILDGFANKKALKNSEHVDEITMNIDYVNDVRWSDRFDLVLPDLQALSIDGWATRVAPVQAFRKIAFLLDGDDVSVSVDCSPISRHDVAAHFNDDALADAGFSASFPKSAFSASPMTLSVSAVDVDGAVHSKALARLTVRVEQD